MRLIAAIATLLFALFLLGAAYSGYTENAKIVTTRAAGYEDKFAPRTTDGPTIEQAEEQGRLAIAGLEGLLGIVLIFAAVVLCSPVEPRQIVSEYDLRGRRTPSAASHELSIQKPRPSVMASLIQRSRPRDPLARSGRVRIEELRQAKNGSADSTKTAQNERLSA
jgi:hypothetical protein